MAYYILPWSITWQITSCLDSLHGLLQPVFYRYMRHHDYMRHYMPPNPLHAPESITSITCQCSRIHYMLPVFTVVNQYYDSIGSGPGHRQRLSDHCVAQLARLARAVNSLSSAGFNLQDNIPACSDQTYSIQMRWLPARGPCKIEVEQCRWWLRQVVLGISRMSMLNIHAILPRTKI